MRTLRGDLMGKVATAALVAVALAGCSSATERFGASPYYTGGTQNQRDILNGPARQPSYQDIANGPGGTAAGLPPASSEPVVTTASIPKTTPRVQSAPLPAVSAPAAAAPVRSAPVATLPAPEAAHGARTWKGWTSAGGTRVQMRQGDSLNSMARRYGVPIQALVAVNGIEDPAKVGPGQSVIIPTYVYSDRNGHVSTTEGESGRVKLPKVSGNDTVVTGSIPSSTRTLPRPEQKPGAQPSFADISRGEVAVEPVRIVQVNTLPKRKPGSSARPLTTASISAPATSAGVPTPRRQPAHATSVAAAPSGSVGTEQLPQPALTKEAKPTAPIKTPATVASVREDVDTSAKFRWPVRGRIISDFGAKPGGGRNEGVNLAVPEGTAVHAADDGTVIYSGNELKGYGNLILVRHSDGWVSAYAHNSELKVKRGDTIRRGDVVALAGATGSVSQPQVHFELRQGNKPVDPLKHLPQR
ncbi:peptidoglycan DD-metalloendopeptidase family protein [Roseibium sediminicola]|uniref:Peptidoglycan DD-metalloendopeptidase family protein n=1 Tax=Roseibium sediminicola TaxID=2933272 RepID=A0ABT0GQZ9_9HYPH|nr:peptidoglycan DD-metalloendopeptidase family protein [Roseibium sp. CAU 1639]MCK7611502.1 peptidoglycan DD-metalloendopeptidase family protein [Roseibium sp. CAU 1639]